ncbi:hypothetical protein LCGC14_1585990 [marine sediment metagenome]|uniref:Uncharacterized protein n=1 Tax=marine sediment metagenome TaxID=412755 RepID=A0A0F9J1J6_9ZZZZ
MTTKNQTLINELSKIENKHGLITPRTVVDEAINELSPLHRYFQWDESKAANEYRLWQARELIAKVRIIYEDKKLDAYYNVKIRIDGKLQQGYASITKIISDSDLRDQVIGQALKEIGYWQKKYAEYEELEKVINKKQVVKIKNDIID